MNEELTGLGFFAIDVLVFNIAHYARKSDFYGGRRSGSSNIIRLSLIKTQLRGS